jgi:dTDP-4-amino-4,6-dideoxygalactose transaminase
MIHYNRQNINQADIDSVCDTLKSQFLTTGPKVDEFEYKVREMTGIFYNLACSSGTSALHLALMSIDIPPGAEVIVPSISFVATANVVEFCGGRCVFADVDPDTLLIDLNDVKRKINENTIAVIGVDMAGQSIDYFLLRQIVGENICIISDSAHNFMGHDDLTTKDIDIICYSFHPIKLITTGEGGMVSTNCSIKYNRMKALRNHGRSDGDMVFLGYNYRMSDISASLGVSQLNRVHSFLKERNDIANYYRSNSKINEISLKQVSFHTNHLFIIKVENRTKVIEYLAENSIMTQINYKPIYDNQWYFKKYGRIILKNTEEIKNNILSIPIYPGLGVDKQDYIIEKLLKVIE